MAEQQSTKKSINLTIRFNKYQLEELRTLASEKGIGVTTLARMWLMERMKMERMKEEKQKSA